MPQADGFFLAGSRERSEAVPALPITCRGLPSVRELIALNCPPTTNVNKKHYRSIKHFTPHCGNPLLAAGLLSLRRCVVSSLHALCPKRFRLEVMSVRFSDKHVRWKKINFFFKEGWVKFFLGRRKNTLLKTLVIALACSGF